MNSLYYQELQSIQDEMAEIATMIVRVQGRITQATRRAEEQSKNWQETIQELQSKNREVINGAKWLKQQNAELERRYAQRKPDFDNAIDARNAAFRKLRYARKVIRDLVQENERLQGGDAYSIYTEAEEQKGMKDALNEALEIEDHSSISESEKTARQAHNEPYLSTNIPGAHTGLETSPGPVKTSNVATSEARDIGDVSRAIDNNVESSSFSVHPDSDEEPWSIHWSKPPASSDMSFGPVPYSRLIDYSIIKEELVSELEGLATASEICLRLRTLRDLAFVYDPIFLEAHSRTYILDWGSELINKSLENYIGKTRKPLHTFVCPAEKKQWFYVGAHAWTVTELWSVWPTLKSTSKQILANKLCERSHERHTTQTMIDALESGELRQLCVEISSEGHWTGSKAFAKRMGYKAERRSVAILR